MDITWQYHSLVRFLNWNSILIGYSIIHLIGLILKTSTSSCSKSQFSAIESFVHSRLNCKTSKVFDQEVEFVIPKSENGKFEEFFQELEFRKVELNIESHGIKGWFESFFKKFGFPRIKILNQKKHHRWQIFSMSWQEKMIWSIRSYILTI